jgi:hypothetical protein
LVSVCHGSPKTQNIKDAIAHAESGKPLACGAAQQMSTVREQRAIAHRLPIVRLLPWATGVDARKQIRRYALKAAATKNALTFFIFILHSGTKVRKVSH